MTKEEFNSIWKDTSREGILNQFYYDYRYMQKLKEYINKAIDYINNSGWLEEDCFYNFKELEQVQELLEILKGDNND